MRHVTLKIIKASVLIFISLLSIWRSNNCAVILTVFLMCGTVRLTLRDIALCVSAPSSYFPMNEFVLRQMWIWQLPQSVNRGSIYGSSQNIRELGPVSSFLVMSGCILHFPLMSMECNFEHAYFIQPHDRMNKYLYMSQISAMKRKNDMGFKMNTMHFNFAKPLQN